jgi:very-short-patch-repair endonuclease
VVPQLIIELDGSVHNFKSKKARDEFIDDLTKLVDLPILHLKTGNIDREFIRAEINKKLGAGTRL